jgi:hypothetical protein
MHHRQSLLGDMQGGELRSDAQQIRAMVDALAAASTNQRA